METAETNKVQPNIEPADCTELTIPELKEAIKNRRPLSGITALITHRRMHWDEFLNKYLLQRTTFGQRQFPGIEKAIIAFKTKKELAQYDLTGTDGWYEALSRGFLITGTGNGPFDEHHIRSTEHPSSAKIIAEYLGITRDKLYSKVFMDLLNYTDYEDRNGDNINAMFDDPSIDTDLKISAQSLLPASYIKMRWNDIGDDDERAANKLVNWGFELIDGYVESRTIFHVHAKKAYQEARKETRPLLLPNVNNKKQVLLVLETDNPLASRYAALSFKGNAKEKLAAILIINSQKQFTILPYNGNKDRMDEVVKIIQAKILKKRDLRSDWKDLGKEGSVKGAEEVHFQKDAGRIMNGSLREDDVSGIVGTLITKEEIIWSVSMGLSNLYHKDFASDCMKGSCARGRCPFYSFGLQRCHDVRKSNKNTIGNHIKNGHQTDTKKPDA